MEVLLAARAQVDLVDHNGLTPLLLLLDAAARRPTWMDWPETLWALLAARAEVNRADGAGRTPLAMLAKMKMEHLKEAPHSAAGCKMCFVHLEMILALVRAGASDQRCLEGLSEAAMKRRSELAVGLPPRSVTVWSAIVEHSTGAWRTHNRVLTRTLKMIPIKDSFLQLSGLAARVFS